MTNNAKIELNEIEKPLTKIKINKFTQMKTRWFGNALRNFNKMKYIQNANEKEFIYLVINRDNLNLSGWLLYA